MLGMFNIDESLLMLYATSFIRIGAILFALPIFGDAPTPARVRVFLALALSLVITPTLNSNWLIPPKSLLQLLPIILSEISVGLVIGFASRMLFEGIIMAASVVGFQMGFGASNLFIPDAGAQMNAFTATHRMLIMLMFLGLNLHHIFIAGLYESFAVVPAGAATINGDVVAVLVQLSSQIFTIGIQLAAPVLISLLFTMGALGLMARTVPQMNVFALSFPISFFVGMVIYIAALPFYPTWMRDQIMQSYDSTLRAIAGLI